MHVITVLKKMMKDDRGATAVEYGLIIAMIIMVMLGALYLVANETISMWTDIKTDIAAATGN